MDDLECHRGRTDCEPLAEDESQDQTTFVCCGLVEEERRKVSQDLYRLCFISETTDSTYDYSLEDMLSQVMVVVEALAMTLRAEVDEA